MKIFSDKRFFKFFIPSLIGVFLFVTPINSNGSLTIPIAVMANFLLGCISNYSLIIITALISISTLLTIINKIKPIGFIQRNSGLKNLFEVSGFWFAVRLLGWAFSLNLQIVQLQLDIDS